MLIFPAIDIKDGNCVRLFQGDFSTAQRVADSYLDTALKFRSAGAVWLHMVDLDGAVKGRPVNSEIFLDTVKNTDLKVQIGGGIRTPDDIEFYVKNGISRVILGSAALKNPQTVKDAVKEYGDKIAVGIDAKNEIAAADGWLSDSGVNYIDLAKEMESIGVKCIIFTDISKDGTLSGVNISQLKKLSENVKCDIIASGGVHTVKDIHACRQLGLYGVICGRSLYNGTLD
ncbi:MAG: 1-(5-phosphoribosyl)-5-[(5-phosphoribosylamino)methylideneamino]imidazole-4-carboxamide isomerase, partial [Oscillospiraceae bacterium]|nr:1-(5-phosphoribosyl)-5-[(5-phosphoribosylamino)methylideneamino]imidazole-4-carboxamide isomerase [Oscillospiraceae bacterium]